MNRCVAHPGERTNFVCQNCADQLVCDTCVTSRHSGHIFRKISEVKEELRNEVRERKESNTRKKGQLEFELKRLKQEMSRQNDNKTRAYCELENRTKELKKQIDRKRKETEEIYRNQHEKQMELLQKKCDRIKREIKNCSKHEIELDKIQNNEIISEMTTQLKLLKPPAAAGHVDVNMSLSYKFVPGTDEPSLDMFGRIERDEKGLRTREVTVTQPIEQDDGAYASMTPSRCSSFSMTSEAASITHPCQEEKVEFLPDRPPICPTTYSNETGMESMPGTNTAYIVASCKPDHCWVKGQGRNVVTLVNRKTIEVGKAFSFSDQIGGISTYRDNQLLVCLPGKRAIRLVDIYSAKDFINTAPLVPRCVCSSIFNDQIFVIVDVPCTSRLTTSSELVWYDNDGKEKKRAKKDTFGNDLFYSPDKISFNRTGSKMAVINCIGSASTHLLILTKTLEPLWRYFGDMRAYQKDTEFDPKLLQSDTNMCLTDVVFDNKDNVVIADKNTNTIKMLNQKMEPVRVLGTYSETPIALAMLHHNSTLWIKFNSGKLSVVEHMAPS